MTYKHFNTVPPPASQNTMPPPSPCSHPAQHHNKFSNTRPPLPCSRQSERSFHHRSHGTNDQISISRSAHAKDVHAIWWRAFSALRETYAQFALLAASSVVQVPVALQVCARHVPAMPHALSSGLTEQPPFAAETSEEHTYVPHSRPPKVASHVAALFAGKSMLHPFVSAPSALGSHTALAHNEYAPLHEKL